nr:immunoglobulin heavy chain junction region [Macaca mulatta]
CARGNSIDYW